MRGDVKFEHVNFAYPARADAPVLKDINFDTAAWADIVIVAVPFVAVGDVAKEIADVVRGKIVVDATNALDAKMALAVGYSTSGAEELQKKHGVQG